MYKVLMEVHPLVLFVLVFLGIPTLTYLVAKFGTFGFYRGRDKATRRKEVEPK